MSAVGFPALNMLSEYQSHDLLKLLFGRWGLVEGTYFEWALQTNPKSFLITHLSTEMMTSHLPKRSYLLAFFN
jgi:hypothetical protein